MKRIFILIILILSLFMPISSQALAKVEEKIIPVIVQFIDRVDTSIIIDNGGKVTIKYKNIPALSANIPEARLHSIASSKGVRYVEVDQEVTVLEDYTWNIIQIGADIVQDEGNTGDGIKIAVIDTGIDYNHPELAAIYKGGYDFYNNDSDPMDDYGHGTHCAGIIAAQNNGVGVIGVAPGIELYAVKVLGSGGSGSYSQVIAGVDWCIDNGIQITSNSYGGTGYSSTLEDIFNVAYEKGILSIAAAGNSGGSSTLDMTGYPARYESVIAVAAVDINKNIASFSSTGPATEVSAPGVSVYSSVPTTPMKIYDPSGYKNLSGTSMACPHVAGLAALITSAHPDWDKETIRGQIRSTADDLGMTGFDWVYGFGEINAVVACGILVPVKPMPPLPPEPIPPTMITLPATEVTSNSARLNGEITSFGSGTFADCSFGYGIYTPPISYGKMTPTVRMTSLGTFTYVVTGLQSGTTYYNFAFGRGNAGRNGFGKVLFFTTLGDTPEPPPPPESPPLPSIYVSNIDFSSAGKNLKIDIILSSSVSDAVVHLRVIGLETWNLSSTTSNGVANFMLKKVPSGTYIATITKIDNYEWDTSKGIKSKGYEFSAKGH